MLRRSGLSGAGLADPSAYREDYLPGMDERVLAEGRAPTPFTAAEIREGCPAGRTIRVMVEPVGHDSYIRLYRFAATDDEGALQESSRSDADGSTIGEPETHRVTWKGLQAHASFPAAHTTIERERIETPMGELDCLRYTVDTGDGIDTFWFALGLPGMPVRYVNTRGDEVTNTVTMISTRTD
jgi:hypothetical protein